MGAKIIIESFDEKVVDTVDNTATRKIVDVLQTQLPHKRCKMEWNGEMINWGRVDKGFRLHEGIVDISITQKRTKKFVTELSPSAELKADENQNYHIVGMSVVIPKKVMKRIWKMCH